MKKPMHIVSWEQLDRDHRGNTGTNPYHGLFFLFVQLRRVGRT